MESMTKRDEPASAQKGETGQGAPSTTTVLAARKDVTVRVLVATPPASESEELKEDGYGHGV